MKNLLLALALCLPFAACEKSSDKSDTSDKPESGKSVDNTDDKDKSDSTDDGLKPAAGKNADGVVVTLIEAGAEPRQQLRFKLNKGDVAKAEMRMTMDMGITAGGMAQPKVKLPVMTAVMEIKMTSADGDVFGFDWVVIDYKAENTPGVMPQVLSGIQTSLKQLIGTKGTGKINSQGRNLGATFETPPGVQAQVAQMMEGMRDAMSTMSAPLPTEPIGVGGSWKVNQTMTQNGMKSNVEYIYKVKSMDGDKITVATELKTTGVVGPIQNSMLPPGATAHLDSMVGSGSGTMTIALDKLVPPASNVEMSTQTKTTIKMGGQTQKTDMSMALGIEMKAL